MPIGQRGGGQQSNNKILQNHIFCEEFPEFIYGDMIHRNLTPVILEFIV